MVKNLKKTFRRWRKLHRKGKIIKLAEGDDNLIAELSKTTRYITSVFTQNRKGFKKVEEKSFKSRSKAEINFKKIVAEF